MKRHIFYAIFYGAVCGLIVAVALWSFISGDRLGGALVGATALPFALFTAMRLNNWRLTRTDLHS